jgi:hypothetical protein
MEDKIILYQTGQGNVTVNVVFQDESFWLTQKAMSELFGVEIPAVSKHLKNIFESGELVENSVISKMETTAADGKNYLSEDEIKDLNLLVNAYLDLAEFQARRHIAMSMKDWITRTNKFLESNSLNILQNAGNISHETAMNKAENEYDIFRIEQDKRYISNFDEMVKTIIK